MDLDAASARGQMLMVHGPPLALVQACVALSSWAAVSLCLETLDHKGLYQSIGAGRQTAELPLPRTMIGVFGRLGGRFSPSKGRFSAFIGIRADELIVRDI